MESSLDLALSRDTSSPCPGALSLVSMLSPAFGALYHTQSPDEATFGEWTELTIAMAHLHVLAAGVDEYEPICNLFGIVFGAMAADARDWYETGTHPRPDTWYLLLLPWLMRRYRHCCKRVHPAIVAATRGWAEERLCSHIFLR